MLKANYKSGAMYWIVSTVLVLSLAVKLGHSLLVNVVDERYYDWGFSDILVNYEGGFVRRGLLGEILFGISRVLHLDAGQLVMGLCYASYAAVFAVMLRGVRRLRASWWILLSPLLCGYTVDIVRKDYLLILAAAALLYIISRHPNPARYLAITLLSIVVIMCHEAFIFWGMPVVAWLMLKDVGNRKYTVPFLLLILASVAVMSIFHGTEEIAHRIYSSWCEVIPGFAPYSEQYSLQAIGYDAVWAMKIHFHNSFNVDPFGLWTFPLHLLNYCVIFYLFTRFPFVIKRKGSQLGDKHRDTLSALFIVLSITNIPMFTLLFFDYARLYQYICAESMLTMMILPAGRFLTLLPERFVGLVSRINCRIDRLIPPKPALLIILLLVVGVETTTLNYGRAFEMSPIGSLWRAITTLISL